MKKNLLLFLLVLCASFQVWAQVDSRIQNIQNNLEVLMVDNKGLSEKLKLGVNVGNISLSNFLLGISEIHQINMNVDPSLQGVTIVNNFSDVSVADLLVFVCKEYNLDIDFTGNILSIKRFVPAPVVLPEVDVQANFDAVNNTISMDLKSDPLEKVFRKIIDESGRNLLYSKGMETIPLTFYVKEAPFDVAIKRLAESNNLIFSTSRDGFYLFDIDKTPIGESGNPNQNSGRSQFRSGSNFNYQVVDTLRRILTVDFENTPIAEIVESLTFDLDLDYYMAKPLVEAGNVSIKAKQIYLDELLTRIFENKTYTAAPNSSPNDPNQFRNGNNRQNFNNPVPPVGSGTAFTFKKENDIYFFGTEDQLSLRKFEVVQMMHRSVELLGDPTPASGYNRSAGRTVNGGVNFVGNGGFQNNGLNGSQVGLGQNRSNLGTVNTRRSQFGNFNSPAEAIVNILPDEVIADLDIKVDYELNSFLVSGPAANINRFKKFITSIDKPVPVVLIEVMLIEVRRTSTVETGISWGIGDEPVETRGGIFPNTDLTLGANTVNKIIGGFDGFGSFNIGQVVPEFFAQIKAMEQNGNIKIRSTPKLSTLNGHRANLSIGETTYYVVTSQNFFGSQIPTSSEVRNFQPIDAELAVSIKPLVSGNGQVTLDINVIQSDFSGERIDEDAPPGLTSREFSSIIRMQNQDLAILGGLEEKVKNDSGNGVPFLARIPVIKWFFSQRRREDTKQKLTILIKPTVIY